MSQRPRRTLSGLCCRRKGSADVVRRTQPGVGGKELENRLARRIGGRLALSLCFQPADRRAKPVSECRLKFLMGSSAVQRIESLSIRRQGDMRAWNLLLARALWDELHQQAFLARFAILGVKVHASGGILENKSRPPGFTRQSPISALLKEFQFELQHIQKIAIILRHKLTLHYCPPVCAAPP